MGILNHQFGTRLVQANVAKMNNLNIRSQGSNRSTRGGYNGNNFSSNWNIQDLLTNNASDSQSGNSSHDSKGKKPVNQNYNGPRDRIQCWVCNKNGHSINKCFKIRDWILGRSDGLRTLVVESSGSLGTALAILLPGFLFQVP